MNIDAYQSNMKEPETLVQKGWRKKYNVATPEMGSGANKKNNTNSELGDADGFIRNVAVSRG